jgi:hypothetical protein
MMDKEDIIPLTGITPKNYKQYYLMKNPFPQLGIPGIETPFTVDREKVRKNFQNSIYALTNDGRGSVTVIVGEYGNGKTHMLKVFKENITSQLSSPEYGGLAIYIQSPGEEFEDLFFGLVENVGRFFLLKYSYDIIRDYIVNNKQTFSRIITDKELQKSFNNNEIKLEKNEQIGKLVQNSHHLTLFKNIKTKYFDDIYSENIVNAFLGLAHPVHSWRAWRWFLGEPLDKDDKAMLDLENTIKDSGTAYNILKDFFKLLNRLGFKSIVILIDEVENIVLSLSSSKKLKYFDFLRQMIDEHSQKVCFYFAIAWRQWNIMYQESSALIRRLQSNMLQLENFSEEDTVKFITKFLSYARVEDYSYDEIKLKFPTYDPALYPFSNDAMNEIFRITHKGQLNEIIELCSKLIEYITDEENNATLITKEIVGIVNAEQSIGKKRYE